LKLFNKLERKLSKFAIKNLMTYIIAFNILVFILEFLFPQTFDIYNLCLVPELVLKGELWRLITFIFIPPSSHPLFIIFAFYFYYMIGITLEQEWGTFRFNLFYFLGTAVTAIAALLTGNIATSFYLNLSLFLAFATLYPNFEILIFFIIPVKIKYLAMINWIFFGYIILFSPSIPQKIFVAASLTNYFVFFGKDLLLAIKQRRTVYKKRQHFYGQLTKESEKPFHKCTICGITEKDNPKLDFRYCSKCAGDHEYCMEHLNSHEHITNDISNQ